MKVSILDRTTFQWVLKLAWLASRPEEAEEDFITEKVTSIDAPINDIPHIVLKITSTILVREIFASARDHIMWAQTSRVNDPLDWGLDEFTPAQEELMDEMVTAKAAGVPQDAYRMFMPLGAKTTYTLCISYRGAVKMINYFDYLGIDCEQFKNVILDWTNVKLPKYNLVKFISPVITLKSGWSGDSLTITIEAPIALRAQAVRHKQFLINDDLIHHKTLDQLYNTPINENILMQLTATQGFWESILEKRSCWMAQQGLWKPVIEKVSEYIEMNESMLPCKISCPYDKDAFLRYSDKDPGAPCPKHASINKVQITESMRSDMLSQIEFEKRPDFWRKIIDVI